MIIIIYYYYYYHFMHGIYNYIPETSNVSRVHNFAAMLYLQVVLHVMLFRSCNMFCTFTLALPVICVQCPTRLNFVFIIIIIITGFCCSFSAVSF
jgi:hypothetical protein